MRTLYLMGRQAAHYSPFSPEGWKVIPGTFKNYLNEGRRYDLAVLFVETPQEGVQLLAEDIGHTALHSPLVLIIPEKETSGFIPALQFPIRGICTSGRLLSRPEQVLHHFDRYKIGLFPEGHYDLVREMEALRRPAQSIHYFLLRESFLPEKLNPKAQTLLVHLLNGATNERLKTELGYSPSALQYATMKLLEATGTEDKTAAVVEAVRRGWTYPVRRGVD